LLNNLSPYYQAAAAYFGLKKEQNAKFEPNPPE
jgi:hypothetical protein